MGKPIFAQYWTADIVEPICQKLLMQKIMVCLERPSNFKNNDWCEGITEFLNSHSNSFLACHFTVEDQHVEPAIDIRLANTVHPKNAVLSIWLENAFSLDNFYADLELLGRHQGYGVVETTTQPFKQQIGRTPGFSQTCFLTKPDSQTQQQWLNLWLGESTPVSMQTQANYSLDQNVITMPLPISAEQSSSWLLLGGIVQDYFPMAAMLSREAFYDATGNNKKYLKNEQKLISSCLRFVDFDHFDCIPMSQYVIKACDW